MMNRRDFLSELINEIKGIEPSELQDILQYYNEFFDDAGVENEQAVIEELGSPKEIAAEIKRNSAVKYLEADNTTTKKSIKSVWIIIGSIFAAPIALPLAIALALLAFASLLTFGCFLFTFFLIAICSAFTGVVLVLTAFFIIPQSLGSSFLMFGLGLILAGLSVLIFIPTKTLAKNSFKWLGMLINRKILRRQPNE